MRFVRCRWRRRTSGTASCVRRQRGRSPPGRISCPYRLRSATVESNAPTATGTNTRRSSRSFSSTSTIATRRATLMDYEQAWQIYTWLNRDVAALLAPEATAQEREIAAVPCHVGQPVKLKSPDGSVKGALRVAVGSRYISRLAFDRTLGENPEMRMRAQLRDLEHALNKTALLVRHWTHLSARAAVA